MRHESKVVEFSQLMFGELWLNPMPKDGELVRWHRLFQKRGGRMAGAQWMQLLEEDESRKLTAFHILGHRKAVREFLNEPDFRNSPKEGA